MAADAPAPQKKTTKPKKPRAPAAHPKTIDMVVAAVTNLKERKGSSLHAIKKYVGANYKVDMEKIAPFIRRALKTGVASGKLVQTKASYKLGTKPKAEKKAKKPKTPKKPKAKKPKAKKPKAATKKPKAKKPKSKTPQKAKKAPAKKPKAAKKTPAKKAPAKKAKKPAKKAAPKKK